MGIRIPGRHNTNCRCTDERVEMALDGALSRKEQERFLQEVKLCAYCSEKYEREKSFKQFLCNKVSRKALSPSFINSLKEKIGKQPGHGRFIN